jgi:hypothetical protein
MSRKSALSDVVPRDQRTAQRLARRDSVTNRRDIVEDEEVWDALMESIRLQQREQFDIHASLISRSVHASPVPLSSSASSVLLDDAAPFASSSRVRHLQRSLSYVPPAPRDVSKLGEREHKHDENENDDSEQVYANRPVGQLPAHAASSHAYYSVAKGRRRVDDTVRSSLNTASDDDSASDDATPSSPPCDDVTSTAASVNALVSSAASDNTPSTVASVDASSTSTAASVDTTLSSAASDDNAIRALSSLSRHSPISNESDMSTVLSSLQEILSRRMPLVVQPRSRKGVALGEAETKGDENEDDENDTFVTGKQDGRLPADTVSSHAYYSDMNSRVTPSHGGTIVSHSDPSARLHHTHTCDETRVHVIPHISDDTDVHANTHVGNETDVQAVERISYKTDAHTNSHTGYESGVHVNSHLGNETDVSTNLLSLQRLRRSSSYASPVPRDVVTLGEGEQKRDENEVFVIDEHDSRLPTRAESPLAVYGRATQSKTHAIERQLESMRHQLIELQQSHRSMSDIINTLVNSRRGERQKRGEMQTVIETDARSLIRNAKRSSHTVVNTDNHNEYSSLPVRTVQSPLSQAFQSRPPPLVGEPTKNGKAKVEEHKQDANEDKKISSITDLPDAADDDGIGYTSHETETWYSNTPGPCRCRPRLSEAQQQCCHCGARGRYTGDSECPYDKHAQTWNGHQAWAERNERMFKRKGRTYPYDQQWWIYKSKQIAVKAVNNSRRPYRPRELRCTNDGNIGSASDDTLTSVHDE